MCLKKYHQNTFAKNKDGLYAILERRVLSPFSSNIKNGGFCSRINSLGLTPFPFVDLTEYASEADIAAAIQKRLQG
jgi:hypothetical protein